MGPKIWMRRVFLAIFYCSFTYHCGNTFTFGSALQLKQEELTFMFSWFSLWSNNGWSIKTIILPNLWTMDFNGWSKRAIEVQLWKPPHLFFFLHGFLSGFKTNSDFNKKKNDFYSDLRQIQTLCKNQNPPKYFVAMFRLGENAVIKEMEGEYLKPIRHMNEHIIIK